METKFSSEDLSIIRKIARIRQEPKDQNLHLVRDKRIIERDNIETHNIGLLGEFALSKLIYGHVDTEAYLSGDTAKDFVIYGVSIEVKTLQGYLAFKNISDFISDIAVLVIYDKQNYSSVWVEGWITRQDFREQHFIDNFGYGDRPCIQPAALLPIATLKTHCLVVRNLRWINQKFSKP